MRPFFDCFLAKSVLLQFTLFCRETCFVAAYALSVWRQRTAKMLSVEKKWQISCMLNMWLAVIIVYCKISSEALAHLSMSECWMEWAYYERGWEGFWSECGEENFLRRWISCWQQSHHQASAHCCQLRWNLIRGTVGVFLGEAKLSQFSAAS